MTIEIFMEHPELPFLRLLRNTLGMSYRSFETFLNGLGRNYVFTHGGNISDQDLLKWLDWVDQYAMPLNKETARVINEHRHLWPELPGPLADFMDYHETWVKAHDAWHEDPSTPYCFWAGRNFPQSINYFVNHRVRWIAGLELTSPYVSGFTRVLLPSVSTPRKALEANGR